MATTSNPYTTRYGFLTLEEGDDLSTADYKFSRADRLLLDSLLTYVTQNHRHTGTLVAPTPPAPPLLTLATSGGIFPASRTIYYRVALVDELGQEYLPSQPAIVTTPAALAVPDPPRTLTGAATPGTLIAGEYLYLLSAYANDFGSETTPSRPVYGTLPAGGNWTIGLPAPTPGISGWNLYRKSPGDLEPAFLVSLDVSSTTFVDDGSLTPNVLRTLPTANTTSSTSLVSVDLSQPLPANYTCKIYRTIDQSDWSRSLLVRTATIPYFDTGHTPQVGAPLVRSTAVGGAPKISLETESVGVPPPRLFTTARTISIDAPGVVQTGLAPMQWVNDYDDAVVTSIRASLGQDSVPASTPVTVRLSVRAADSTVWTERPEYEATVPVGASIGDVVAVTYEDLILSRGDAITASVVSNGGGSPQTDTDLTFTVALFVRHGSATDSYVWKED